jgi:hypothetical protein
VRPLHATNPGIRACRPVGRWLCWCPRSLVWLLLLACASRAASRGWCGGSGGRSRCPRRPIPGGAAVAGVPHQLVDDLAAGRRAEATSRRVCRRWLGRWPARWRTVVQVRCSASCCASARVRVWPEPRPWLSGRGRPEACMSACWRCAVSLVGERRLGQTAERSRSRAGVRSGSWVGLVHGVALTGMGR